MKQRFTTRKLAFLGMMTALVFASNYARIIMPIAISVLDTTISITINGI